ncbi:hypothetical protein [Comamonas terrae]|uniref:Terminase small subunit n=1 Tax=Comamonas terrae TaxID=673548 RepID=A0ABW5UL09_9BURK|nr:hypothetical protein [Comamonas terrae]
MNGRVELITQAEYARRRGVAKSAVAKAVKEGRITLIDGKIDPAVADIQWAQNTRARADAGRAASESSSAMGEAPSAANSAPQAQESAPVGASSGKDDYQALRVRREMAAVEREERENAREAGLLLDRREVSRGVFDAFRALRDEVFNAPQRSAPRVVGLADVREIEHVLMEELRKAFTIAERRLQDLMPEKPEAA